MVLAAAQDNVGCPAMTLCELHAGAHVASLEQRGVMAWSFESVETPSGACAGRGAARRSVVAVIRWGGGVNMLCRHGCGTASGARTPPG